MKVKRSVVIDAPIDKVWSAVRSFDAVVNWNPGVTGARLETSKTIIACNAAVYWQMLRSAGIGEAVKGYGKLLQEH